jgi:CHASE1-domain containing sensor protein
MSSGVASPETMANQLAFLQIDLSEPEFHQLALAYTTAVREEVRRLLDAAIEAGELEATGTARLAQGVQTTYNGALITWAIYRKGRLAPGCGASSTRCSRRTEPHDPYCV